MLTRIGQFIIAPPTFARHLQVNDRVVWRKHWATVARVAYANRFRDALHITFQHDDDTTETATVSVYEAFIVDNDTRRCNA